MKFLILFFSLITILSAHEDPTDVIDTLTHKLEKLEKAVPAKPKKQAELYFQRGIEHLAVRDQKQAKLDFLKASELDPQHSDTWLKLAEIETAIRSKFDFATRAHKTAKGDHQKCRSHYTLAECFYLNKKYPHALSHCDQSILLDETKSLTRLLFKSHILFMQGEHDKRVIFLKQAQKINPSIVLRNQGIDAMIDAGNGDQVRAIIEKELTDSRFKSSWYIRLARIDTEKRKHYVEAAFKEIKNRQNKKQPDFTLLADLVRAYKLYGYHQRAENTLNYLKLNKHDPWQLAELKAFKE